MRRGIAKNHPNAIKILSINFILGFFECFIFCSNARSSIWSTSKCILFFFIKMAKATYYRIPPVSVFLGYPTAGRKG